MGGWKPEEQSFRTSAEETVRQAMMEDAARRVKEQMNDKEHVRIKEEPRDDCAYLGEWNDPRGED